MTVRSLQTSSWFVVFCLVVAVGCNQQNKVPVALQDFDSDQATTGAKDDSIVFDGLVIHQPVVHENLTIFPVSRVEPNLEDRFITLDEGLKNGTVEVFELGLGNGNSGQSAEDRVNIFHENEDPFANEPSDSPPPPLPDSSEPNVDQPNVDQPNADQPNADQPNAELKEEEQRQEEVLEADGRSQNSDSDLASQIDSSEQITGDPENQESRDPEQQTDNTELSDEEANQLMQMVQQRSQGNSVNKVYVLNRSDRPLYLMPGEILLGGDQDRTIGEEIVIAPSKEPVQVEVFCVEHGRWGGRSRARTASELNAAVSNSANAQSFAANLSLVTAADADISQEEATAQISEQLSSQAENGQFIASVGLLTKKARLAAQGDKDQSKVWDEVALANSSAKSQVASGAFTQNYVNEENIKRFEGFIESLQDKVVSQENVVGVVVAVNGKIDGVDVFESTPLFRKLWPKLLKSYALEAANQAVAKADRVDEEVSDEASSNVAASDTTVSKNDTSDETSPNSQLATCTMQDALDFLKQAKEASETKVDVKNGLAITHRSDESVDSFSLQIESPAASATGGGGFGGGAVHFSGFSK